MNNLSDFANFGELQFWGGGGWEVGAPGRGRQTEVCAPGAKNHRYASVVNYIAFLENVNVTDTIYCRSW